MNYIIKVINFNMKVVKTFYESYQKQRTTPIQFQTSKYETPGSSQICLSYVFLDITTAYLSIIPPSSTFPNSRTDDVLAYSWHLYIS